MISTTFAYILGRWGICILQFLIIHFPKKLCRKSCMLGFGSLWWPVICTLSFMQRTKLRRHYWNRFGVPKSWLIGKDSDAGRDWGQEEKGTTEDEMAGWHHWLDGRESEWTPGVGDGQGGLACSIHGVAKSRTRLNDWSDLIWSEHSMSYVFAHYWSSSPECKFHEAWIFISFFQCVALKEYDA